MKVFPVQKTEAGNFFWQVRELFGLVVAGGVVYGSEFFVVEGKLQST